MAIGRAVLVIADIGGYTRFMKVHQLNLAHAQDTVAQLLEAVIDGAGSLQLAKLEGDAAFFWLPVENAAPALKEVGAQLVEIRRRFLARRGQLLADRMCDCDSCLQMEQLSLKFVAHEGEVAIQKVKHLVELAGVDVILVHRMLKNDVPLREYALITDAVLEKLEPEIARLATPVTHDFEGIGPTRTHYIDMQAIPIQPAALVQRSWLGRLWQKAVFEVRSAPYLVGLRKVAARGS